MGKSIETESWLVGEEELGEGGMGSDYLMSTGFFLGWWKSSIVRLCVPQICKYTKNHWIAYFKWVNLMVCKLHLKQAASKKNPCCPWWLVDTPAKRTITCKMKLGNFFLFLYNNQGQVIDWYNLISWMFFLNLHWHWIQNVQRKVNTSLLQL